MGTHRICGGVLALAAACRIAAAGPEAAFNRVRTSDPTIAAAIAVGYRDSVAFRRTVEEIEASDVIVYVEPGTCRVSAMACLTFASDSGRARYLRVTIRRRRADTDLVARIGHELYHAVEIARAPRVVDARTMADFYLARSHRPVFDGGFETEEARNAESQIALELMAAAASSPRAANHAIARNAPKKR